MTIPRIVLTRHDLPPGFEERFWAKVDRRGPDECWPWTGAIGTHGYGVIGTRGKETLTTHTAAWIIAGGSRPRGTEMTLDHTCENRPCANAGHLQLIERGENVRKGSHPSHVAHRAGTCTKGHLMSGENLYVSPGGQRQCRTCNAERKGRRR